MTTEPTTAKPTTVAILLAIDALLITVFAALGITSHDGELGFLSIMRVATPFLIPYLTLAILIKPSKLIHNVFPVGISLWLSTVILGPVFRSAIFNETSAWAFIFVTAGVLAIFLIGRRIISTFITRRAQKA